MSEVFDPHSILLKLRNPHNSGRDRENLEKKLPPPYPQKEEQRNEERNNVIEELENEVKELSSEVSRLRVINKQLINEKKGIENQLFEQKEKSDDVIAKLRS